MADAPLTDEEALYTRALEIVLSKPSVAYLQRTLGVSYAKAGDLLERMLYEGLITGYSGRRSDQTSPQPPAAPLTPEQIDAAITACSKHGASLGKDESIQWMKRSEAVALCEHVWALAHGITTHKDAP